MNSFNVFFIVWLYYRPINLRNTFYFFNVAFNNLRFFTVRFFFFNNFYWRIKVHFFFLFFLTTKSLCLIKSRSSLLGLGFFLINWRNCFIYCKRIFYVRLCLLFFKLGLLLYRRWNHFFFNNNCCRFRRKLIAADCRRERTIKIS